MTKPGAYKRETEAWAKQVAYEFFKSGGDYLQLLESVMNDLWRLMHSKYNKMLYIRALARDLHDGPQDR